MSWHGLSEDQLAIIKDIVSSHTDQIEKICLFGSRAKGTFEPTSDIDIVLYGADLTQHDIDRLSSELDASDLAVSVDIMAYHLIDYPPLREHIKKVAKELIL